MGEKSSPPGNPTTGLCTTPAWKTQPGYRQFSVIGRWILDPADPANYTRRLAQKKVLLQEADKDTVVPNLTTANLAALLGLTSAAADPAVPPLPPPASAAITTNPMTSKWVRYVNLPANATTGFPGNTFHHASLLSPTLDPTQPPTNDGSLGVARMLSDVITYLTINQ